MKNIVRMIVGLVLPALVLLVAACSSTPQVPTGMEAVARNQTQLKETRKELSIAQRELGEFQRALSQVRDQLGRNQDVASRERATSVLSRLSLKVEEAQLDMRELLAQNKAISEDLNLRLKKAAEANSQIMSGTPSETPTVAPTEVPAEGAVEAPAQ